jgi:hypothetical protein
MASDETFLFCPLGFLSFYGQKRKGSSEAIKRRRTDNPMDKRERVHQRL